jgi:virginiamycin B lyase
MTALLALAALGSLHLPRTELPPWSHAPAAQPALSSPLERGVVTLFDDSLGDPTPAGITEGPDGALWFTDPGNDVIGRITIDGRLTEFPVGAEVSTGITTGPDGALWFTLEQSEGGIGQITTSGAVTLFNDSGGSFPQEITVGPDGALWFTESNGLVGRMTTGGKVRHYTVGAQNAMLTGIVGGPDGALWLTQFIVGSHDSNQVIRLTTHGKTTTYTVGSGPDHICVGPDGALWFTEAGARAIGRLSTNGRFSTFSVKSAIVQPAGIAAGPDGALWFTDFGGKGIGRLTTSGHLSVFPVPGSVPTLNGIAAGPHGAMWFASEMFPSAIGRITTR